eukprot:TRINITY_DN3190_c0_g1_i3.p1 TRINITY_DN3190_c0_g1~~TRINITY_DN3190_c0_g1_i3.p1  ORF type:complete len:193 (+),score=44.71 TRINITY_DN3190_c0_g1_i3:1354-1932(+)
MEGNISLLLQDEWIPHHVQFNKKDKLIMTFADNNTVKSVSLVSAELDKVRDVHCIRAVDTEDNTYFICGNVHMSTDVIFDYIKSSMMGHFPYEDAKWEEIDDYPSLFKFEEELDHPATEAVMEDDISSEGDDALFMQDEPEEPMISQSLPIAIPGTILSWDESEEDTKKEEIAALTYQEYFFAGNKINAPLA